MQFVLSLPLETLHEYILNKLNSNPKTFFFKILNEDFQLGQMVLFLFPWLHSAANFLRENIRQNAIMTVFCNMYMYYHIYMFAILGLYCLDYQLVVGSLILLLILQYCLEIISYLVPLCKQSLCCRHFIWSSSVHSGDYWKLRMPPSKSYSSKVHT